MIVDKSRRGVKAHFDQHHPRSSLPPYGDTRTNCEWHPFGHPNGPCGNNILKTHVVKHICDVHLQLDVCSCPICGRNFTRHDAFRRHLNNPNIQCGRHMLVQCEYISHAAGLFKLYSKCLLIKLRENYH